MNKKIKAFTLVELIVVITILAILGTISFISLQGYSKKARDSKRIADISNIKTSLELFSLNAGYYPLPDNGEEVLYDNDLLWTQGIVGNNVTTNLSRNLQEKPTDPLHDIEYIYSLASSKKEYEVMSIYEGGLANNSLINSTYALDKYSVKVEGNYNELFIKTSRHIFPVPSIITSATLPLDFDLVPLAIESQVITGGNNFPGLSIPNTETSTGALKMTLSVYTGSLDKDSEDDIKKAVVEKIQLAYSGSDIETTGVYKTLLSKTGDEELLSFVDDVVLNQSTSSSNIIKDTEAPSGGSMTIDSGATNTNSTSVTLNVTCPTDAAGSTPIEIAYGNTPNPSNWTTCTTSISHTLTSGDGTKTVYYKFQDSALNETTESSDSITLGSALACGAGTYMHFNDTTCTASVATGLQWVEVTTSMSANSWKSACNSVGKAPYMNRYYPSGGISPYQSAGFYAGGSGYSSTKFLGGVNPPDGVPKEIPSPGTNRDYVTMMDFGCSDPQGAVMYLNDNNVWTSLGTQCGLGWTHYSTTYNGNNSATFNRTPGSLGIYAPCY